MRGFGIIVAASLTHALSCRAFDGRAPAPRPAKPAIVTVVVERRPAAPTVRARSVVRAPSVRARAMAVSREGSIHLIGATEVPGLRERVPLLTPRPGRAFGEVQHMRRLGFVAAHRADGTPSWQRMLELGDGEAAAVLRDVAVRSDGTVCAIAHEFVTEDNASVYCFSRTGEPAPVRTLAIPRCTTLVALADGSLVAGGSKVLGWKSGWAHAAAWLARIDRERVRWQDMQLGEFASRSSVDCMARTAGGDIVAGGRIGRRNGGPTSRPWLAKWDGDGKLLWSETMPFHVWREQQVRAVAVAPDGEVFAAGFGEAVWVRRYDGAGRALAEHRFPAAEHIAGLFAIAGGYVVHGATSSNPWDPARGPFTSSWIRAYSRRGELLWSAARRDDCIPLGGVQAGLGGELLALLDCRRAECEPGRATRDRRDAPSCREAQVVGYAPP